MTHAFAANNAFSDELTVFINGSFAATNTFVFSVVRVDVFDWAKNSLTEQAVALRFLGTVVNGFWF